MHSVRPVVIAESTAMILDSDVAFVTSRFGPTTCTDESVTLKPCNLTHHRTAVASLSTLTNLQSWTNLQDGNSPSSGYSIGLHRMAEFMHTNVLPGPLLAPEQPEPPIFVHLRANQIRLFWSDHAFYTQGGIWSTVPMPSKRLTCSCPMDPRPGTRLMIRGLYRSFTPLSEESVCSD